MLRVQLRIASTSAAFHLADRRCPLGPGDWVEATLGAEIVMHGDHDAIWRAATQDTGDTAAFSQLFVSDVRRYDMTIAFVQCVRSRSLCAEQVDRPMMISGGTG